MSSNLTWIRGPICGTDNCRSRLYRNSDGLKICQFGHVLEGEIEINDDEDDYVQTKRLNMKIGKKAHIGNVKPEKKFGFRGRELYLKCFQIILRSQCLWIIDSYKCGSELEEEVKVVWLQYLQSISKNNSNYSSTFDNLPSLIYSLHFNYIAILRLKIPIYISDLIQNASSNKLPYMKLTYLIPKKYLNQLPNYFIQVFEPTRPPIKNDFYLHLIKLTKVLDFHIELIESYYFPLILKLIKKFNLTMDFFQIFLKFFKLFSTNINLKLNCNTTLKQIPELQIVSSFVFIVKIYFTYYSEEDKINHSKWIEKFNSDKENEENFNLLIIGTNANSNSGSKGNNFEKLITWNDAKINNYLNWFNENIIQKQNQSVSIMEKRLFNIFDFDESLPNDDKDGTENSAEASGVEPANANEEDSIEIDVQNSKSRAYRTRLTSNEVNKIENFLVENIVLLSGITTSQLKLCIINIEEAVNNKIKFS